MLRDALVLELMSQLADLVLEVDDQPIVDPAALAKALGRSHSGDR